MILAAAALVLVAAGVVLGVGLYLMHSAHSVRRESDRTISRLVEASERERRELHDRYMHALGRTFNPPPPGETPPYEDLFKDIDVNVEGRLHEEPFTTESGSL